MSKTVINEVKQVKNVIKDADKDQYYSPAEDWEKLMGISDDVHDMAEDDGLNHHIDTAEEALDLIQNSGISFDDPYYTNCGITKGMIYHALDVLAKKFDPDDWVESPHFEMDYRPLSYETVSSIAKDIKNKLTD